jgi:hypothetical protein
VLRYHALLSGRGCPGYTAITVTVLSASKDFTFAAVVDTNGKLIVGKYRKKIERRLATTSIANSSWSIFNTYYLFYVDYFHAATRQSYFDELT